MTDPIEMVSWWTPTGFYQAAPTPGFATMLVDDCEDWNLAMERAGYQREYGTAGEFLEGAFEVWTNTDGHLYVSILDHTSFLIEQPHRTAFWVTLFPSLQAAEHAVRQTEAIELQAKALVAWVRYGNDKSTISETGFTRDDNLRCQEDERRRKASKAKA